jgi:hypothetical protein
MRNAGVVVMGLLALILAGAYAVGAAPASMSEGGIRLKKGATYRLFGTFLGTEDEFVRFLAQLDSHFAHTDMSMSADNHFTYETLFISPSNSVVLEDAINTIFGVPLKVDKIQRVAV